MQKTYYMNTEMRWSFSRVDYVVFLIVIWFKRIHNQPAFQLETLTFGVYDTC